MSIHTPDKFAEYERASFTARLVGGGRHRFLFTLYGRFGAKQLRVDIADDFIVLGLVVARDYGIGSRHRLSVFVAVQGIFHCSAKRFDDLVRRAVQRDKPISARRRMPGQSDIETK